MQADTDTPDAWVNCSPPATNNFDFAQSQFHVTDAQHAHTQLDSQLITSLTPAFHGIAIHGTTPCLASMTLAPLAPAACLALSTAPVQPQPQLPSIQPWADALASQVEEDEKLSIVIPPWAPPDPDAVIHSRARVRAVTAELRQIPPRQRCRSTRACDACRISKCRCFPEPTNTSVCSHCYFYGRACTYEGEVKRRGPPKRYVESIETRLFHMEKIIADLAHSEDPRQRAVFDKVLSEGLRKEIHNGTLLLHKHDETYVNSDKRSREGGKRKRTWQTTPPEQSQAPAAASKPTTSSVKKGKKTARMAPVVKTETRNRATDLGFQLYNDTTQVETTTLLNTTRPSAIQAQFWIGPGPLFSQGSQSAPASQSTFSFQPWQAVPSPAGQELPVCVAGAFPYVQYSASPAESTVARATDTVAIPSWGSQAPCMVGQSNNEGQPDAGLSAVGSESRAFSYFQTDYVPLQVRAYFETDYVPGALLRQTATGTAAADAQMAAADRASTPTIHGAPQSIGDNDDDRPDPSEAAAQSSSRRSVDGCAPSASDSVAARDLRNAIEDAWDNEDGHPTAAFD